MSSELDAFSEVLGRKVLVAHNQVGLALANPPTKSPKDTAQAPKPSDISVLAQFG